MGILNDIRQKCKGEWFTILVLVLTASLAFGLGRWSKLNPAPAPVRVESATAGGSAARITNQEIKHEPSSQVVGSRQGSKYHLPTCPGAKSIKAENLITFASVAEAQAAGYEPAANCPGLN